MKFANENPVTNIETMEGDQPGVRAFAMWSADAIEFCYHTGTPKSIWKQLQKKPKVELCFYAPGDGAGTMMPVAGSVEFLSDKVLEERLYQDRPRVKDLAAAGPAGTEVAMFRVAHGEAYFWTMADNMRGRDAPRVKF